MPIAIAELIFAFAMVTVIGLFLLAIPITRRLGRVLDEWIKLRNESQPDRELTEQLVTEVRELSHHIDSLEQRMDLVAERQDFTESLIESGRKAQIPESVV
ncbi:MAG: hypothetical protein V3U67_02620 [Gemmatimonadota bacterium]